MNNKLEKNGVIEFTRFFDDKIGAFDLQQKLCEASDVSIVAFFLPNLPDPLISNAVSVAETLHIPILTTKTINLPRNTSYLITLGVSQRTRQRVLRKIIKSKVGSDYAILQCDSQIGTEIELNFDKPVFRPSDKHGRQLQGLCAQCERQHQHGDRSSEKISE